MSLVQRDPTTGALSVRTPDSDLVDRMCMTVGGLRAAAGRPDLNDEFRAGLLFALNKMEEIIE